MLSKASALAFIIATSMNPVQGTIEPELSEPRIRNSSKADRLTGYTEKERSAYDQLKKALKTLGITDPKVWENLVRHPKLLNTT